MKYLIMLIMCVTSVVLLNGMSEDFNNGSIVIEFHNSLNPIVQDGVVLTGYAKIDSLNASLGAIDFEYHDLSWTSRLKYLLVLYFDESRLVDVQSVLDSYLNATVELGIRIEYISMSKVNSIPGEYLYSENIYHPEDTIFNLYNDNEKRNWRIHARYQYLDAGHWVDNIGSYYPIESYWGTANPEEVNELLRPFPYKWAYHGHGSLWHHLEDYNNTYKAWDYTEGEQTLALCLDLQGFWMQHPDLIDRWLPGYPQASLDGQIKPSYLSYFDWWRNKYHGTSCVGALAASKQPVAESELTHLSSVGVAPKTMLIGRWGGIWECLHYLNQHPELSPSVLSISYTHGTYASTILDAYQQAIDMGITIVASRGYSDESYTSKYGSLLEGFICVGDYRPDWRLKTSYQNPDNNVDEDLYKADINAPGWEIWVPNIYHTYESGFSEIGYGLSMGTDTSIATPQVAGVVCLVKSLYPWMTPAQVERQIKLGAHHLDDMIAASASFVPNTPPSFFGAGCLNAYSSLFLHGDFQRNFTFSNEANNTALIGKGFTLNSSSMRVDNGTLRIEKDAHVIFNNSTLTLGDNVTVLFESGSKLDLDSNSNLVVGNNVTFRTENDESCQGLLINGDALNPSIVFNNTIFTGVPININNTEVTYSGCTFTKSNVTHNNMPLSVNQCGFFFSGLQVIQTIPNSDDLCSIRNSEFTNSAIAAIQITGYPSVKIRSNTITYNYRGIELYECSQGVVSDNNISFNGSGVLLYNSNIDITGHNTINYNHDSTSSGDNRGGYGIDARHLTSWNLIGNDTMPFQVIHDNQREQILMQSNSIVSSMYLNRIYSASHLYPYIRIWDTFWGAFRQVNISNNYWSNDFVPTRDLVPETAFLYLPLWEPGIPLQVFEDEASLLYAEAMTAAENMDYIVAEQKLKQIITEYSETKVCLDATKQLLILVEKYNQNYEALELYYTTYPTLRNDPILMKMADYLANFCKMKSGDYPEAIQFFEDLIQNPPSEPDSIFAVIDAGYAYLLMAQNSEKSSYTGDLKWLKPASISAYLSRRDALMNNRLLPNTVDSQTIPIDYSDFTLHNYPNPFNPSTTISYSLPESGDVLLEIYNLRGQKVKTLVKEVLDSGAHKIVWNGTDKSGHEVSSGIYFYRLTAGRKTLTKRMLLLK